MRSSRALRALGILELLGFMQRTKCGSVLSKVSHSNRREELNCFEIESSFNLLTWTVLAPPLVGVACFLAFLLELVTLLLLASLDPSLKDPLEDKAPSPPELPSIKSLSSLLLLFASNSLMSLFVESRFFSAKLAILYCTSPA